MQTEYAISIDLISTCEAIGLEKHELIEIVSHGIIEPGGFDPEDWAFDLHMLSVAKRAVRLQRDLHLDWAAVGLVVELIEERDKLIQENNVLRSQLSKFVDE